MGGVAVLYDAHEDVLSVVRDLGRGSVQGVLGVEVDKDILRLRSADPVVEQSLVDVGGSFGSRFTSVYIRFFKPLFETRTKNERIVLATSNNI